MRWASTLGGLKWRVLPSGFRRSLISDDTLKLALVARFVPQHIRLPNAALTEPPVESEAIRQP